MPFDWGSAVDVQEAPADKGVVTGSGKSELSTSTPFDFGSMRDAEENVKPEQKGVQYLEPLQAKPESAAASLGRFAKKLALEGPASAGEGIDINASKELKDAQSDARSKNVYALSESLNLPISEVDRHYNDLILNPKILGFHTDNVDAKEALGEVMKPFIVASFLANPVTTVAGVLAFSVLDKAIPTEKFIPSSASLNQRNAIMLADFIVKGAILGGIYKGFGVDEKIDSGMHDMVERFTLNKMQEYKLPSTVTIEPGQVRDIWQTGTLTTAEQKDLLTSLDLTSEQRRLALEKGVSINVPAQKITRVTPKPYWEKISKFFGLESGETVKTETAGEPTQGARPPKGLLTQPDQAKTVQEGGGIYVGYEAPLKLKYGNKVYFNSPATGSTLTLSLQDLSAENVRKKIEESDSKFTPEQKELHARRQSNYSIFVNPDQAAEIEKTGKISSGTLMREGSVPGKAEDYEKIGAVGYTVKGMDIPLEYLDTDRAKQGLIDIGSAAITKFAKGGSQAGFIDPKLIPGFAETADFLKDSSAQLTETLAASKVSRGGEIAGATLRENLGKMARSTDMVEAALAEAKKIFDKSDKEKNLEFIYRTEEGAKQETPELQAVADSLRALLDKKRKEVQDLGTGKLESFIENYFPHIWEDPAKAKDVLSGLTQAVKSAFGKRPLEGSKAFLKKRTIESTRAGVEKGLVPVSYNPVELTMLKVREMDRYIMAHRTLNELKAEGLVQYVRIGKKAPDGWVKIDDKISTVMKSPMIPIKEAFDEQVMEGLHQVAQNLGIDMERTTRMPRVKGGDVWGLSHRGSELEGGKAAPGKITTKFAGPESVIAHEIGHQLDEMFGLQDQFLPKLKSNKVISEVIKKIKASEKMTEEEKAGKIAKFEKDKDLNKEFQKLADLRWEGKDASGSFKQYVRKGPEKMAVMLEAYIHAPDKFKKAAPTLFKMYEALLESDPRLKPLTEIEPSLVLGSAKSEVYAGGMVIAGHLYAQPDAARIVNNYLKPGLRGNYFFDLFRGAGNSMNQFQLGISAFHLGFTSMDATVSRFALGLNEMFSGEIKEGLKSIASAPAAPVTNFMKGDKLLQAWYGKPTDAKTALIADLMATAGGRAKMDKFYATEMSDKITKSMQEGKYVTAAMQYPFMLVEKFAKPILEDIVPRQKLGVFFDLMNFEVERNPEITHEELRASAQKIWDSVDNRMGQLVYDNLFWSRTTKDLAMVSVRSVGWNLGTIRELGGGAIDLAKFMADLAQKKKPEASYKMAYLMALPMVAAIYGAIYQYLHTGKAPASMRDYFYPQNGKVDRYGQPARISLPTYMKDIYHYTQHPVQTVKNKFSPVFNTIIEMLDNKDFYGAKIRNEDDPFFKQVLEEAQFVAKQNIPFAIRNAQKNLQSDVFKRGMTRSQLLAAARDAIEPQVGITPAPYDVNMTPAEKRAHDIGSGKIPVGSRTQEQMDKYKAKSELAMQFSNSKDESVLNDAVAAGKITDKEKDKIVQDSTEPPLVRITRSFSAEEVASVLKRANENEKNLLLPILENKINNREDRGVSQDEEKRLEDLRKQYFGFRQR